MVARLLAVAVLLISTTASCLEAEDTGVGANLEGVTPTGSIPPTSQERLPRQTEEAQSIAEAATSYGLPEAFFRRLIWQESQFNPRAVSRVGAQGIAQFMPRNCSLAWTCTRHGTVERYGKREQFLPLAKSGSGSSARCERPNWTNT